MDRFIAGARLAAALLLIAATTACQADRGILPWTRPPGSLPGVPSYQPYLPPPFTLVVAAKRPPAEEPAATAIRFEVRAVSSASGSGNGEVPFSGQVTVSGTASRGTLETLDGNVFVWRAPTPAAGTDAALRFLGVGTSITTSIEARVRIDAAGALVVTGWAVRPNAFPAADAATR